MDWNIITAVIGVIEVLVTVGFGVIHIRRLRGENPTVPQAAAPKRLPGENGPEG